MKRERRVNITGVLLGLMLIASACGGSDSATDASQTSTTNVETDRNTEPSQPPLPVIDRSDFCGVARQFASSNPFGDLTSLDASAFAMIDEILIQAEDLAPSEIRDDVRVTRMAFNEFNSLLEKYDFNFFDADLLVELEAMNTDGLNEAGGRVSDYMRDECEIDIGGDGAQDAASPTAVASDLAERFGDVGDVDAEIAALMQVLGVDPELAECLNMELEDFDLDNQDPELLTQEVCGTTLLEILSSVGSSG